MSIRHAAACLAIPLCRHRWLDSRGLCQRALAQPRQFGSVRGQACVQDSCSVLLRM
jgi:hypothetical protein